MNNKAAYAKPWRLMLNAAWLLSSILLIVGLTRPMFTFTHFYFFDDTFSLVDGVFHLAAQGEFILFGLLFVFSLLMPLLKMAMLLYTINAPVVFSYVQQQRLDKLAKLGKWSMLDVYVIAILAVTVKLGMIATVSIHYGLVAFAVSVTMSMFLPWLISYAYLKKPIQGNVRAPQWSTYPQENQAIKLDESSINYLIVKGDIDIELNECLQDALIDIYDSHGVWHAKTRLARNTKHVTLKLIAHR